MRIPILKKSERVNPPRPFPRIPAASNKAANLIQFTGEYEKNGVHAPIWQDIRTQVEKAVMDAMPGPVAHHRPPAGPAVLLPKTDLNPKR